MGFISPARESPNGRIALPSLLYGESIRIHMLGINGWLKPQRSHEEAVKRHRSMSEPREIEVWRKQGQTPSELRA